MTARHLARRSAERRRIEEALRLGAADLSASDGTTCNVKSIAAENVGQSMNKNSIVDGTSSNMLPKIIVVFPEASRRN